MKTIATTLLLCLIGCAAAAVAQEFPEMPAPQPEHRWLEKFTGQWTTESEAILGPEAEPVQCKGTMSSRSIGGSWVVNEIRSEMLGMSVNGIQTIGYDPATGQYVGTWIDSSNSLLWHYKGSVDDSGKRIILEADGPNMMAEGKLTKFRDQYEFKSDKEILASSSMLGEDGKWVTFMTGTMVKKE
jgi:hypothetical protein